MSVRIRKRGRTLYLMWTYKRKHYVVSTGISIDARHWNEKRHELKKTAPGYEGKVLRLKYQANAAEKELLRIQIQEGTINLQDFKQAIRQDVKVSLSFTEEYERWLEKVIRQDISDGTYKRHKRFFRLYLTKVSPTPYFPYDIDQYKQLKKLMLLSMSRNTFASYMRSVFGPFLKYKKQDNSFLDRTESYGFPETLNVREIEKWKKYVNTEHPNGYKIKVKDLFLCQYYTGMRYSDTQRFSLRWIKGNIIEYVQAKTGGYAFAPYTKDLKEILKKYDNKMPKISNQKYNAYLKVLAKELELNRKVKEGTIHESIKSHWARRAFISHHLDKGIPPTIVMQMVGKAKYESLKPYIAIARQAIEKIAKE